MLAETAYAKINLALHVRRRREDRFHEIETLFAFVDAGYLWTRRPQGPLEQDRFRSVGAGGRVNIGGFILEVAAARPFDRIGKGWTASVLLRPGF